MSVSSHVTDISNSPAFTFLDELLRSGKLTRARVDEFKDQYQTLHEVVIQSYHNEKLLLDKVKERHGRLDKEAQTFNAKTVLQRETQAQLELLQKEKKASDNVIAALQRDLSQLDLEVDQLAEDRREKKLQLEERHRSTLAQLAPIHSEIEADIKKLQEMIGEKEKILEKENKATQEKIRQIQEMQHDHSLNEREHHRRRAEYTKLKEEPEKIRKNVSRFEGVRNDLEAQTNSLDDEIKSLNIEGEEVAAESKEANREIEELGFKLENFRMAIAKRETNIQDIKRFHDQALASAEDTQDKKEEVMARLQHLQAEKKRFLELTSFHHKQCEAQKNFHEKIRRKRDTVISILPSMHEQQKQEEIKLREMEDQLELQQRMLREIKQDEELFISQYLAQEKMEKDTEKLLEGIIEDQQNYEEQIQALDFKDRELQKEISRLSASRELMARDASKATASFRRTKEDLKVKNLILMDLDKQTGETKGRLSHCSDKYERMKNQRNKLANMSQSSSQALAEMKEKIKILQNEVEILRNESLARDRALAEEIRIHQGSQNQRDALRVEQNKHQNLLRQKKAEQEQQAMEIDKLNSIVQNAEEQMLRLRHDYARAVDNRNRTGIQLIDRNDELCILYEKSNIQESILKQGDEAMRQKEEEIRIVTNESNELRRKIEVARKNIPSLSVYAATTRTLQAVEKQLKAEQEQTTALCHKLETPVIIQEGEEEKVDPNGLQRCRILKGSDPEPEQLVTKIEVLEERLNDKKEQLLEKELVLDEVTSLSDKMRMQAAERRQPTLDLAKKVNEYQAKIRATTRKMMATVSELSMYQATAMKLEQKRQDNTASYEAAMERMAQGLPPTDEAEQEWYRLERERIRRAEQMVHRQQMQMAELQRPLGAIVPTRAEPRPNAYIPEELGIPKPYGALAPFKPSQPGSTMRHIRRPILPEIQL